MQSKHTRSTGDLSLDVDVLFPAHEKFQPPTQLPTKASVISMMRFLIDKNNGLENLSRLVVLETAKQIYAKYFHDTVYCFSLSTISRRVQALWKIFSEGKRRIRESTGHHRKIIQQYEELIDTRDKLFDMSDVSEQHKQQCLHDWGVKMTDVEARYLEDQKGDRKMECDKAVDPVWYTAMMRKQRMLERQDTYREERDEQFKFQLIESIELIVEEDHSQSEGEGNEDYVPLQKSQNRLKRTMGTHVYHQSIAM